MEHTAILAHPELVAAVSRIVTEVTQEQKRIAAIGQARINEIALAFRGVDKAPEGFQYDHAQKSWVTPPTAEGK